MVYYQDFIKGVNIVNFKELVSPSLTDLFVNEIQSMILSGKLAVGQQLPNERELAQKMNVSRAVVNGGISQLEVAGFVNVLPRKGTFVADFRHQGSIETLEIILNHNSGHFSPEMLDSIFEIRLCLEHSIVRLAAEKADKEDIAALKKSLGRLAQLEEPEALSRETFHFYHLLSIASGNMIHPLLTHGFKTIYIELLTAVYRNTAKQERMVQIQQLVKHIENGNGQAASDIAMQIIQGGRSALDRYYSTNESRHKEETE